MSGRARARAKAIQSNPITQTPRGPTPVHMRSQMSARARTCTRLRTSKQHRPKQSQATPDTSSFSGSSCAAPPGDATKHTAYCPGARAPRVPQIAARGPCHTEYSVPWHDPGLTTTCPCAPGHSAPSKVMLLLCPYPTVRGRKAVSPYTSSGLADATNARVPPRWKQRYTAATGRGTSTCTLASPTHRNARPRAAQSAPLSASATTSPRAAVTSPCNVITATVAIGTQAGAKVSSTNVSEGVGVWEGTGVRVAVRVAVGVAVPDAVSEAGADGDRVPDSVAVPEAVREAVAVPEGVAVCVGVAVRVWV